MARRVAWLTVVTAGMCAVAVACSGDPPPSTDGVGQALPTPPPRSSARESIYDAEGNLRESETVVAGLTLPMGLEEDAPRSTERRHFYYSNVPHQKVLSYFGPRLNTVEVEHTGDSVVYRNAVPQGVRGGVVRLDVRIEPTSAHPTSVEVYERPPAPPPGTKISEESIRRHLDTLQPERRE